VTAYLDTKIEALCAHDSQMKLTVDDLRASLQATGKCPELLPLLERDNYRPALEAMIRAWAARVGARAGFQYGEEFRREEAGGFVTGMVGAT
jgi:hypothetical protein